MEILWRLVLPVLFWWSDFCGRIPIDLVGRAVISRHYATVASG